MANDHPYLVTLPPLCPVVHSTCHLDPSDGREAVLLILVPRQLPPLVRSWTHTSGPVDIAVDTRAPRCG